MKLSEINEPLVVWRGTNNPNDAMAGNELYFTPDQNAAKKYVSHLVSEYLTLINPLVVDYDGREDNDIIYDTDDARDGGHNGVIAKNTDDGHQILDQYIVSDKKQVRAIN